MKVLHGQLSQTAALIILGCLLLLSSIMSLVIGRRGGVYSRKSQSISTEHHTFQIYPDSAAEEWAAIFPPGSGFIQFAMALRKSSLHVHHCFTYLRQVILCEANPTIEPVIPIIGRRSVNAEVPRVCKDWTKVYKVLETAAHRNLTM
ncbi:hypothetical protein B0H13DRAFT_2100316 [Mycena leptocephala]|nr:hypothetical protein B0H13DRAFT_2100316 [Mycena leptocephala]